MSGRFRIAHVITRLELGGAQQNTLFCTRRHDRSCFEVQLIAGRGGMLDAEAREIRNSRVVLVPYLEHAISPWRDLRALFRLRRHFKSQGIGLVHTHSSKAGILGRLAAFLAGVPVILHTVHGWSFNETQPAGRRRVYIALERLAASLSDRLIVVSSRDRDKGLALRIGRAEQYTVLRSGIDIAAFRRPTVAREEMRRRIGFDAGDVVVGSVGNFKPQKAPLDFVRAAAAAHAKDPRLRFFIAGDGEQRPEVEALIERLGLGEVVRLLGWRDDVVDLFHAMDVFLLTSLFEGLPRSVLQAMAARVPVVATDVDGTPEVVKHGVTGLLAPPGRPEVAAERVLELLADADLRRRCVEGGQRRLTQAFDIRRMVTDLDRLYLSLLSEL